MMISEAEYIAMYVTSSPTFWELLGKSLKIWAFLMVGVVIMSLIVKYKDAIVQLAKSYDDEYKPRHGGKHKR